MNIGRVLFLLVDACVAVIFFTAILHFFLDEPLLWGIVTVIIFVIIGFSKLGDLFFRIFMGLRPLPEKFVELQNIVDRLSNDAGMDPPSIFMKRSGKLNAYAVGSTTIIVTTKLIKETTYNELVAVLAHEIAHIKYGHTKFLLARASIYGVMIPLLNLIIQIGVNLPLIGIVFIVLSMFIEMFFNLLNILHATFSRGQEYQADGLACELGYGANLKSFFRKLAQSETNKGGDLWDALYSTHPPTKARIERIEKNISQN